MNFAVPRNIDHEIFSLLKDQSLLGWLITDEELLTILQEFTVSEARAGEVIFKEGTLAVELIIVIAGEVNLLSASSHTEHIETGVLCEGRSANLHALVRQLPYQYSGVAARDVKYYRIPWSRFSKVLKDSPTTENYLKLITEDAVIQSLAKEISEIGCSQKFKVGLLGRVQTLNLASQSWILQQGNIPNFTFILINGTLQSYQKPVTEGKVATLCPVPARTWIGWNETLNQLPIGHSFRATGISKLFILENTALEELKKNFADDFQAFSAWVEQATNIRNKSGSSNEREEIDLENLFLERPRRKWKLGARYPWVAQENEMDCGPACLAMISRFHANEIPIQYWRNQVFTNRQGTSIFDLAKGAEKNGFEAHGLYLEDLDDLSASMLPVIVVRQYHFLVLYKVSPEYVIVGDPASGIRRLKRDEFYNGFENAVLLLHPTEEFNGISVPASRYGHYLKLFQGYGPELRIVLFCSALWVGFSLVPPVLLQMIMDHVLVTRDFALLYSLLAAVALITLLQSAMAWLRGYYVAYLTTKFDFRANTSFLRKMFSLPYSYFANHHVGDFTRRLSEMERLREFLTHNVLNTVLNFFTLVIYGIALACYSPLIAVVVFCISPVLVLISMLFTKMLQSSYLESFNARAEEESLLGDLIRGIPTIKALTAEVAARWRLEEKVVRTLKARHRFTLTANTLHGLTELYGKLARLSLMGLAAYLALKNQMSAGQIITISVLVNYIINPFQELAGTWAGIQEMKAAMTRLNDIFLSPSEGIANSKKNGLVKQRLRGDVEFVDVWFRYGGESSEWVLKGISFRLEPGTKIAIAGPSGSGKSTIANLMLRLFEPTQGQILIDGRDHREYDLHWLRSQLGLILQESHLFHGSVSDNIGFGDPACIEEKIIKSAIMANAHDFIMAKPAGYQYTISHGGHGLSGGEKQRISCARAFYLDPPVLILDEATSALDGVAERELLKGLLAHSKERTVLSIAHRYTTARHFNQVLLLNSGKVVGFGSHEHLARSSALYRTLFGLDEVEVA